MGSRVRIHFAAVSKPGCFRSLHGASVHLASFSCIGIRWEFELSDGQRG